MIPSRGEGAILTRMETTILIDRPGAEPTPIGEDPDYMMVIECPGNPLSSIWVLCDIETAGRRHLLGAVRMTPPQETLGAPQVTRVTGILAIVDDMTINLLSGSERRKVGLFANETIPLRFRLRTEPPYDVYDLDADDPRLPLEHGAWTRHLQPIDLADDVEKLAPMPW